MTAAAERPDTTTEAFAERIFEAVLSTMDVFSIYIGEKLGLYRALADQGRLTVDELAHLAGIDERYAREWLEQQTVTGILEVDDAAVDPDQRRYILPPAHAGVLVDVDSLDFLAPFVRLVVAGGIALPQLLDAYRSGQGVSWAEMGTDARTGQADMNRPWFLQSIGREWFPAVPQLHDRLLAGGTVADIACGEGWSSIAIALAYPKTKVHGHDIDGPSIEAARRHAEEAGVADRVTFHAGDAATVAQSGTYDAVVGFEFIHDLPDPVSVLKTMRKIAKADAPVIVMDENVGERFTGEVDDIERMMYGFSLLICLPDGMAHQPTVATGTVMRPDTMRSYARQAGFADVEVAPIDHDLWRFYRLVKN